MDAFVMVWNVQDIGTNALPPSQRVYKDYKLRDHIATATASYSDGAIYNWLVAPPPR